MATARGTSRASWALFLAVAIALPFRLNDYWTFNVTVGLVLAISCAGLRVLGWTGQISLMQAGLTGAAVHLNYWMFTPRWGPQGGLRHHFLYSAVVTIGFTTAVAVGVGLFAARRALLLSVAVTAAVQYVIEQYFFAPRPLVTGPSLPAAPRRFLDLDLSSDRAFYWFAFAVLLVVLAGVHRLRGTRVGRAMVAVGHDPVAAAAVGVNPIRIRFGAFALTGLLTGVAAVLSTTLYRNEPGLLQLTSYQSLVYVAVAVVAGSRSGPGLVLAVVGLHLLTLWSGYGLVPVRAPEQLIAGVAMVAVLLLRPALVVRTASWRIRWPFVGRLRPRRVPSLETPIWSPPKGRRSLPQIAVGTAVAAVAVTAVSVSMAARDRPGPLPPGITEFDLHSHLGLSSIVAGSDNKMWFTGSDRIGRITSTGQVDYFGELSPVGQTYAGLQRVGGELWFTESGGTAGRIDSNGAIIPSGYGGFGPLAVRSDGSIWSAWGPLFHIGPTSAITQVPVPKHVTAGWIVAGADGNLWFIESRAHDRVWRYTAGGRFTATALPAGTRPQQLISGSDGSVWFLGQDRTVWRIDPAGRANRIAQLPDRTYPGTPTVAPDGNLWFAGSQDNLVRRITPGGQFTTFTGLPTGAVTGNLVPGPDGNLWFVYRDQFADPQTGSSTDNHTLARITPSGVITVWRIPGTDLGSLTAGPGGTLWFTAEHEDVDYPGNGRIGRVTIAELGPGRTLPATTTKLGSGTS